MIKDIIIGKCIEQRINELGMSKSEFAKKIGVLQPNVGRILESDNIKTDSWLKFQMHLVLISFSCMVRMVAKKQLCLMLRLYVSLFLIRE